MRANWGMVLGAGVLGYVAGAAGGLLAPPEPGGPVLDGGTSAVTSTESPGPVPPPSDSGEDRVREAGSGTAAPSTAAEPEANGGEARRAEQIRQWISDLAAATESKDRKRFDAAIQGLIGATEPAAHVALRDLVADPEFEFPDGRYGIRCSEAPALQASTIPGWTAALRARYERDGRRPGYAWDGAAWLHLLAAHGDAGDLSWISDRYETATERPGEVIASLGYGRPALARDALLKEIRRQPLRDGIWRAIDILSQRSPEEAFAVLHAMVGADPPVALNDFGQVLRKWVRCAPEERLGEVRARVHAFGTAGVSIRILIEPIQALADRGQDVEEFASLIASAGRELRRLVDEERTADGTGPYYAIEYHRVAQTPENLAALEYAFRTLGEDRAGGCRDLLAKIRNRSEWR